MLKKRIIPCLDVKDGWVVKGVQFKKHEVLGPILDFAKFYRDQGADELVFYDITASSENRSVSKLWIREIARTIDIPFCVAGGIRSVETARMILNEGADKISINSPALENPNLINQMAQAFGTQCVVVGVDTRRERNTSGEDEYLVYQYTGSETTIRPTQRNTMDWLLELQDRGAGEVVLNCMNQDGTREGYDLEQLKEARARLQIPLVASGGAGKKEHFKEVFLQSEVDAALAAGVFHRREILIPELKNYLKAEGISIR